MKEGQPFQLNFLPEVIVSYPTFRILCLRILGLRLDLVLSLCVALDFSTPVTDNKNLNVTSKNFIT